MNKFVKTFENFNHRTREQAREDIESGYEIDERNHDYDEFIQIVLKEMYKVSLSIIIK